MTLARRSTRIITPVLEELSEFEVELPAWCRPPLRVNLVEPIPDVHTQRSEWAQCGNPEACAPEQPGRIELARLVPNIAAFEESVQVERLIDPETELPGSDEERVPERRAARLRLVSRWVEATRRDGALVIAAQLLSVLGAAERESREIKNPARVTESGPPLQRQSRHEHHRLRAKETTPDPADRSVRTKL